MKIYEAMILYDPEFGRDDNRASDYSRELIEKCEGQVVRCEKYAEQKLAYEIKKRKRGVYVLAAMRMEPSMIKELERQLVLDENVLRSLVIDRSDVLKNPDITVEKFFRTYEPSEEDIEERRGRDRDRDRDRDRGGRR